MAETRELRAASVRDLRPLVRRDVRRKAEQHDAAPGLIVAGQFPVLMTRMSRRSMSSLSVRVGQRRSERHVTWLLRERTRERISWWKKRIKIVPAHPFSFRRPLGPKWVPLDAGESYILEVTSYSGHARHPAMCREYEISVGAGEKRLLFWDGTDRAVPPKVSLRRL